MNQMLRAPQHLTPKADPWNPHLPLAVPQQFVDGLDAEAVELPTNNCLSLRRHPRLVVVTDPASPGAEQFRLLASRMRLLQKPQQFKKVAITSTLKGEGKSMISANLALTLAPYQRTLLIDGDLRQSGLREFFPTSSMAGLSHWWKGTTDISSFLIKVNGFRLWFLPSGEDTEQPLEILQSPRMSQMLSQLAAWFDWILVDTPPLVLVDPHIWTAQTDRTLLVVKLGKTPQRDLQKALENSENLRLLGVVANYSQDTHQQYYRHYYKTRRNDRAAMAGYGELSHMRNPYMQPQSSIQQLTDPSIGNDADGRR